MTKEAKYTDFQGPYWLKGRKKWRVICRDASGRKVTKQFGTEDAALAFIGRGRPGRKTVETMLDAIGEPDGTSLWWVATLQRLAAAVVAQMRDGNENLATGSRIIAQLGSAAKSYIETSDMEQEVIQMREIVLNIKNARREGIVNAAWTEGRNKSPESLN